MKFYFRICGKIVSPSDFMIVTRTHAYSFPRLMVFYFELVEVSMNLGHIVKLERPEIFIRPPAWLLYSFLAQIFLQWIGLEKEYRKQNRGMDIMKIVDKVDKETSWLKIRLGGESSLTLRRFEIILEIMVIRLGVWVLTL